MTTDDEALTATAPILDGSRTLGANAAAVAPAPAQPAKAAEGGPEATTSSGGTSAPRATAGAVAARPGLARSAAADRATASATGAAQSRAGRRAVLSMAQTRTSAPSRAVSSAGALGPEGDDEGVPLAPRPRPVLPRMMLGPVHVGQVVAWQAAVLLGVAVVDGQLGDRSFLVAVVLTVVGLGLLLVPVVPIGGRWGHHWVWLAVRFLCRSSGRRHHHLHDDASQLPSAVLPGSVVVTLDLDDDVVGMLEHPAGVTVVLVSDEWGADDHPARLPSPTSVLAAVPPDGPQVSVQLLTVRGVAMQDVDDGPAAMVYGGLRHLAASQRLSMLALHVPRTPDRWSDDDLADTMGALLRGVRRRLAKQDGKLRAVTPGELAALFEASVRIHGPGQVAETWRDWQVPQECQVSFRVTAWPARQEQDAPPFLDVLAQSSQVTTVTSLSVRRPGPARSRADGPDDVELEAVVRLCGLPGPTLDEGCGALVEAAEAAGAQVRRCDGEQRAGAVATSPFGGFLS